MMELSHVCGGTRGSTHTAVQPGAQSQQGAAGQHPQGHAQSQLGAEADLSATHAVRPPLFLTGDGRSAVHPAQASLLRGVLGPLLAQGAAMHAPMHAPGASAGAASSGVHATANPPHVSVQAVREGQDASADLGASDVAPTPLSSGHAGVRSPHERPQEQQLRRRRRHGQQQQDDEDTQQLAEQPSTAQRAQEQQSEQAGSGRGAVSRINDPDQPDATESPSRVPEESTLAREDSAPQSPVVELMDSHPLPEMSDSDEVRAEREAVRAAASRGAYGTSSDSTAARENSPRAATDALARLHVGGSTITARASPPRSPELPVLLRVEGGHGGAAASPAARSVRATADEGEGATPALSDFGGSGLTRLPERKSTGAGSATKAVDAHAGEGASGSGIGTGLGSGLGLPALPKKRVASTRKRTGKKGSGAAPKRDNGSDSPAAEDKNADGRPAWAHVLSDAEYDQWIAVVESDVAHMREPPPTSVHAGSSFALPAGYAAGWGHAS